MLDFGFEHMKKTVGILGNNKHLFLKEINSITPN